MADLWPAALYAAIATGSAQPFFVLELDLPVSGTVRFGKRGISSLATGHYEERVLEEGGFGRLKRSASDRRNNLVALNATIRTNNADRYWSNKLGARERIVDATARLYLGAAGLGIANWWTALSGRVGTHAISDRTFTLSLRPRDGALQTDVPRIPVVEGDWPNADQASYGKFWAVILGLHDSTSSKANKTSDGALPTLYVKNNANPFKYGVGLGGYRILRAYKDGAILAATAWSQVVQTVNGKPFTTVDFTTSQGTSAITVDCYGLDTIGDGTGDPIITPVDQLRHLADHVVFNPSMESGWTGTWPSVTSVCDFANMTALAARGPNGLGPTYVGALYLDTPTSALQIVSQFGQDFELRLYWKNSGKLGIYFDDPSQGQYVTEGPWLRFPSDYLGRPVITVPMDDRVDRIQIQTSKIVNLNKYLQQVEMFDPHSFANAKEALSPMWGPASE